MISGKSVLAIIPAREGSKRCPEKNWTIYTNKSTGRSLPLISWAIEHAKSSKYIDTIAISSDSDLILAYAKPPIIPIKRPAHLASDLATSEAVIAHAIYSLQAFGEHSIPPHDIIALLQPTSPLRTAADIDACIEQSSSRSIGITSCRPNRTLNGAVYAIPSSRFLSTLKLQGDFYIMPDDRSLDIDTPEDFLR